MIIPEQNPFLYSLTGFIVEVYTGDMSVHPEDFMEYRQSTQAHEGTHHQLRELSFPSSRESCKATPSNICLCVGTLFSILFNVLIMPTINGISWAA